MSAARATDAPCVDHAERLAGLEEHARREDEDRRDRDRATHELVGTVGALTTTVAVLSARLRGWRWVLSAVLVPLAAAAIGAGAAVWVSSAGPTAQAATAMADTARMRPAPSPDRLDARAWAHDAGGTR